MGTIDSIKIFLKRSMIIMFQNMFAKPPHHSHTTPFTAFSARRDLCRLNMETELPECPRQLSPPLTYELSFICEVNYECLFLEQL